MKKVVKVIIFSILCLVLLAGCGKEKEGKDILIDTEYASVEVGEKDAEKTEESVDESEKENEPVAKEPKQEAVSLLKVSVQTIEAAYSDTERGNYGCVREVRPLIYLLDESKAEYPELAITLETMNEENSKEVVTERESLKELYESSMEYDEYYSAFVDILNPTLLRADSNVLSYFESYSSYTGGVHGYYAYGGAAFDTKTGKKLNLGDIITDKDAFTKLVAEKLTDRYGEILTSDPMELIGDRNIEDEGSYAWSMDYEGINVYFNPYEIASYADGAQIIRIRYADAPELFVKKYTEAPKKYITALSDLIEAYADVNHDGAEDYIQIFVDYNEYDSETVSIAVNGKTFESGTYDYGHHLYYVNNGERSYIYIFHTVENDYPILEIVDVNTMESVGDVWEFSNYGCDRIYKSDYDEDIYISGYNELINPEEIVLLSRCEALGSYTGSRTYHISLEGKPVSDEDYYMAQTSIIVKNKEDIRCEIVDESGNVIDSNATLPKDSMIRIVRTDDKSVVDVQVADYEIKSYDYDFLNWYTEDSLDFSKGTIYRLHFDADNMYAIDGKDIFELFDGLMFAG